MSKTINFLQHYEKLKELGITEKEWEIYNRINKSLSHCCESFSAIVAYVNNDGGEMVEPEKIHAILEAFVSVGIIRKVEMPVYGLYTYDELVRMHGTIDIED